MKFSPMNSPRSRSHSPAFSPLPSSQFSHSSPPIRSYPGSTATTPDPISTSQFPTPPSSQQTTPKSSFPPPPPFPRPSQERIRKLSLPFHSPPFFPPSQPPSHPPPSQCNLTPMFTHFPARKLSLPNNSQMNHRPPHRRSIELGPHNMNELGINSHELERACGIFTPSSSPSQLVGSLTILT